MMKKFGSMMAVILCLCLLLVGCGAADGGESTTDVPTIPQSPDLKVADCYTYTDNQDGTYSYSVKGRSGLYLLDVRDTKRPASFAVGGDDVLIIHGTAGGGHSARWATFCNIQTGAVSNTFSGYLAAVDGRVAFVEQRTGIYHVFVCDPFNNNTYDEVYTLEGITVLDGTDPITDVVLNDKGVLAVTYTVEDGQKTMEIDLNAK